MQLTKKVKWTKIKRGWKVYLYSIDCITIFVSDYNWPWFFCRLCHLLGWNLLLHSIMSTQKSRKSRCSSPFWVVWAFAEWYACSNERCSSLCIGAYSFVWSSGLLCDHIASIYNTRYRCTTSAYRRNDLMLLSRTTVALKRTSFVRELILFTIILATVYEPNLFFGRTNILLLCLWANCERGFNHISYYETCL